MRLRLLVSLVIAVALVGLAAGCGGGQEGDQSQNSGNQQNQEQGEGGERNDEGKRKSAKGVVGVVQPENNRFAIRPGHDEDPIFFRRYDPEKLKVTRGGEEARPEDIERGQQVKVIYVVKTSENEDVGEYYVPRVVRIKPEEDGSGGGEKTGGEGGGENTG